MDAYEEELSREYDKIVEWFNEELNIQPTSIHKEMKKVFKVLMKYTKNQ